MNSRAEIVAAIQKASSLTEQAELVTQLDQYDAHQRRVAADQRSIDLTDTVVRDTLSPVAVHEMHSISTDWLGSFEAAEDSENHLLATAALWYGRTSPELRADPEEFIEQAKGIMRREASAYGERANAAYSAGMEYLAFRLRREAASGLDQIDQTVAPDGVTSAPTAIPPDVFDNFAPEVNEDNAAVVGNDTSERNPLLQQIQSEDGGQGQPEWGHGTWDESWGRTPDQAAPGEEPTADDVGDAEYNQFQASVAIGHLFNMDQFRAEAASTLDQVQQTTAPDGVTDRPTPLPGDVMFPWTLPGEENPQAEDAVSDAQAAIDKAESGPGAGASTVKGPKQAAMNDSANCRRCDEPLGASSGKVDCGNCGLTHNLQQSKPTGKEYKVGGKGDVGQCPDGDCGLGAHHQGPHQPKATAAPGGVAMHGSRRADPNGGRVVKEADMFGNSDAPHAVPQPNVANNPATTPHPVGGAADGKQDASIGNAPTVSDGTTAGDYADGFSSGIAELHENDEHSVPSAVGGDNGTGLGNPKAAGRMCSNCTNGNHSGTNGTPGCTGGSCSCTAAGCGKNNPTETAGKGWMNESTYPEGHPSAGKNRRDASLTPKTSALFVTVAAADNRDFKRAYAYASKWEKGTPLVKRGSAEFEAGLYAGISDNPAAQSAWVQAHRKWANKGMQELATRVQLHATFTRRVAAKFNRDAYGPYLKAEAATTTDLDTLDPSASPSTDGSTPINGIGQPGPLDGKQDAAAPGGASPYNGAEPFGQAAVPNGRPSASTNPADLLINDVPGGPLDGNARAYAFRRQVQANLLAAINQS